MKPPLGHKQLLSSLHRRWIILLLTLGTLLSLGTTQVQAQSRDDNFPRHINEDCREQTLPLIIRGAISLVKLEINGKLMTFIVDSAGTSMINADRVPLHVVEQLSIGSVTVATTTSLEPWDVVKIGSLRIGKEEFREVKMLSRSLPHLERELHSEVGGILGADLLRRWDAVVLDYKHATLRLGHANCTERHEDFLPPPPLPLGMRRP
jgi:hypothetical protein